jgi:hypothetical protein
MTQIRTGTGGRAAVGVWFFVMLVLGAGLLARHLVAMPSPARHGPLEHGVASLRNEKERGAWLAVHVLYAECRCSQRIVDHLLVSPRPADFVEVVLWVGDAPPPAGLEARFDVRHVSSDELATLGIEAAPLLVAVDAAGHVRYAGGYTSRKQGPDIEDQRLLREARNQGLVEALPLFGCAVSDRLKYDLSLLPAL